MADYIDKVYVRFKQPLGEALQDFMNDHEAEYQNVNDFVRSCIVDKLKSEGYLKPEKPIKKG